MKRLVLIFSSFLCATAAAQDWQPVTGVDEIKALFSDTVMHATLKEGVEASATYNRDGTGELRAWGDTFARRWEVRGDDQVCIEIDQQMRCFNIAKDAASEDLYRGTVISGGESIEFTVTQRHITISRDPASDNAAGGAGEPSAEEIAQKLANPNAPMASLTFRLQHRTFDGNLPGASSQNGTAIMFQPSFPFSLDNGDVFFFRPNIPIQLSAPAIDPRRSSRRP